MLSRGQTAVVFLALVGFCLPALPVRTAAAREVLWIEGEAYVSSSAEFCKMEIRPIFFQDTAKAERSILFFDFLEESAPTLMWIRLNPFRNASGGANYSFRYRRLRDSWGPRQTLDVSEARSGRIDVVDPGPRRAADRLPKLCPKDLLHPIDFQIAFRHDPFAPGIVLLRFP